MLSFEKGMNIVLCFSYPLDSGNIVLMRIVNSMIEFKQIIGRGTRLWEGKDYFTVIDFAQPFSSNFFSSSLLVIGFAHISLNLSSSSKSFGK